MYVKTTSNIELEQAKSAVKTNWKECNSYTEAKDEGQFYIT